ncbi:MAG: hypothetical protein KTR32_12800 [Granulosicoccus sp.]|nr:hypothetical protein [Granulosicoccus sp.]
MSYRFLDGHQSNGRKLHRLCRFSGFINTDGIAKAGVVGTDPGIDI